MIIVDTSVWIDHFRRSDDHLVGLLDAETVLLHPFVLMELALGHLHPRAETLRMLGQMPQSDVASNDEVLHLIERRHLFGLGIGFVDVHLLAASITMSAKIRSNDKRLHAVAEDLGVAYRAAN